MSIDAGAQVAIILLASGPCMVIVNLLGQVCTLGRAPRTKEILPDFREWCRVTRHPRVFRGLTGCQRTPGFGASHSHFKEVWRERITLPQPSRTRKETCHPLTNTEYFAVEIHHQIHLIHFALNPMHCRTFTRNCQFMVS